MKTFYLSMAADLIGVYIEFQAESRVALEQYLEREYLRHGVWKLPWCAIYTELDRRSAERIGLPVHVVKAQCGQLFEECTALEYSVRTVDRSEDTPEND